MQILMMDNMLMRKNRVMAFLNGPMEVSILETLSMTSDRATVKCTGLTGMYIRDSGKKESKSSKSLSLLILIWTINTSPNNCKMDHFCSISLNRTNFSSRILSNTHSFTSNFNNLTIQK